MSAEFSKLAIRAAPNGIEFHAKVVPGASRTRLLGMWGTALRISVAAAPEAGKANAAVIRHLAEILQISPSQIELLTGQTSPLKTFRVRDLSPTTLLERLTAAKSP